MSLPRLDHIGIIVEDLDWGIALFESLLDLPPAEIKQMDDAGLRIATLKAENIDIELIQYLDIPDNFGKKTMGTPPGINHIAVRSDDVRATAQRFEKKGVRIMDGFPRAGSHGTVAFFDKKTTGNILLEICGFDRVSHRRKG